MKGFTDNEVADQLGKTFFITGGNAGIGFETAKVLTQKNARVLIGCRSETKAAEAIGAILAECPNADIDAVALDLADVSSIESAAKKLAQEPRLDVLINNAGIMTPPLEFTAQGFESQFGVNHLGPFVLTALLLEKLEATPNARIVNTSSLVHRSGKILFDDLDAKANYSSGQRYSQSKLANLLFSHELQRRLQANKCSTIAVACHPGIADTELSRHMPVAFKFITPLIRRIFNTPAQGAWPTLMAATCESAKGGDYFGPGRFGETSGPAGFAKAHPQTHDESLARQLWEVSAAMTGHNCLESSEGK